MDEKEYYLNETKPSGGNLHEMYAAPKYDQATQPLSQQSSVPNIDHGIHAHQDIASILDRHIQPNWTTPKLEKLSVHTRCKSCRNEIYTRVGGKVSKNGIAWAILCCCFGSFLLSLLVFCLDGFKVYDHFCPSCNSFIGEYSPQMSTRMKVLLVFLSLLCVGLIIFVVMSKLTNWYYLNS